MCKKLILGFFLWFCFASVGKAQEVQDLLEQLNKSTLPAQKITLQTKIGLAYQKQNAHQKATEYLDKAYQLSKEQNNLPQMPVILQGLVQSYTELKNYKNALATNQKLVEIFQRQQDETNVLRTLQTSAYLAKLSNQDNEAITFYNQTLALQKKKNDIEGQASSLNNLGYLYKRLGNTDESLKHFTDALNLYKTQQNKKTPNIAVLTNIGVCYANLSDFKQAKNYFIQALNIAEQNSDLKELAKTNNYLAANYHISGNDVQALSTAQKALEYGNAAQNEEVVITTYHILAQIYQKDNNFEEYNRYNKLFVEAQKKMSEKEAKQALQVLQNQADIERKENELKSLIAERDLTKLEKEKQSAEIARKQAEVNSLKSEQIAKEQALQNSKLRQEQIQQALELAQRRAQQAETDEKLKDQEIQALKSKEENILRDREMQILEIKNKEERAQRTQREKDLKILEATNKAQTQQSRFNQYVFALSLAIALLVLFFVLTSLYFSQRARRTLASKNKEIETQKQEIMSSNEELQQNQEEILAQREFISGQNQELTVANQRMQDNEAILQKSIDKLRASEEKIRQANENLQERDKQISSSIIAAKTIQTAILPYPAKLELLLKDYFIIYHPKDVVSGDFYWLNEVQDKTILVVADCTGHGVPGAFMTLIGNSLLDKIVRVWDIIDPAQILERLHQEIRIVLRQDFDTNNSGMDLIVTCIEQAEGGVNIVFSGAKNSLYYTQNGEIQVLKANRKSVGGDQNENKFFTNQTLFLPKGSMMYLSTDGFIDQNDLKRKRLGDKAFTALLQQTCTLPTQAQQQALEKALQKYMEGTLQRDDISLIGVKV